MTIPGTLSDGGWPGYVGPVSFYRRFGKPSNLGTGERIRLAFERVTGPAELRLNGEPLGSFDGSGVFDVTGRLRERNELEILLQAADDQAGIVGDVAIEIDCS
jgi:hypothetical protein